MKLRIWMMAAVLATGVASAATLTFDFTASGGVVGGSGFSNTRTYTNGSLDLTITGWGLSGGASNDQLQRAEVGFYQFNGLGTCSQDEGLGDPCYHPLHQMDNVGGAEFLLFSFNQPVELKTLTLQSFGYVGVPEPDSDATYWVRTSNSAFDLTNATLADLAAMGFFGPTDSAGNPSSTERTVNLSGVGVTHLLFGAEPGGDFNDYFKIRSLGVDPVPEPATFGLMGAALICLGLVRRTRRS